MKALRLLLIVLNSYFMVPFAGFLFSGSIGLMWVRMGIGATGILVFGTTLVYLFRWKPDGGSAT